jgi:hypothetical protein
MRYVLATQAPAAAPAVATRMLTGRFGDGSMSAVTTGTARPGAVPATDIDDNRAVRRLAFAASAASLAWITGNLVWPQSWLAETVRLGLAIAFPLGGLVVSIAGLLAQGLRYRLPAGLRIRAGGVFTVPAGPLFGYLGIGLIFFVGGGWGEVIHRWRTPDPVDLGWLGTSIRWADWVSTVVVTLAAAVYLSAILGRRWRIDLTPTAAVMRDPFGSRTVAWDSLRTDTPVRVTPPPLPSLTFALVDPAGVVTTGLTRRTVRLGWSHRSITAAYFAAIVTWYVQHPEQRSGIGTQAGYQDLVAALGTPTSV